ncbi:MAG: PspA/IM30 family protein [Syntrophomonadaceae bacterium]|nr:PspA/IM30 family protein [Syntrophomonadaceae bacterium]
MNLFKRINDNLRANLNALLDKAEDPVKLLNQYLMDMGDDIADAEGAVARQLVSVQKFKVQYDEALELGTKRESQAMEALQKNREDLARRALEDKKMQLTRAAEYKIHFENARDTAERLKGQLKDMKDEYEQLKAKRDTLSVRAQAAKAQKDLSELRGSFSKDNAKSGFERMQEKIMQMEAEAAVAAEMETGDSLDRELSVLGGSEEVDRELAKLKEKLKADTQA